MKLTVVYHPISDSYDVYECDGISRPHRIVAFDTESDARTYCEARQQARVIGEYDLSPTAAKPENPMTDSG
jgi:hypothetical protein